MNECFFIKSDMHDAFKAENNTVDDIPWNWKTNESLPFSKAAPPHPSQNYYFFGYNLPQVLLNNSIPNHPLTPTEISNNSRIDSFKKNSHSLKIDYSDDSNDNTGDTSRFKNNVKYHPSTLLEIELNTSEPDLIPPSTNVNAESMYSRSSVQRSVSSGKYPFSGYRYASKESFKCTICDKECVDKISLESHLSVHGQRCKIRKCDYCDQTFSSKGKWYAHFKSHFNDPSFDCVFCNNSFVTETYLQEHLKIHSSKEVLSTCNVGINHAEEKHYPCTFCGKKFPDRSSILFHLRIHTSDIVFRCMYCNKMFLNKSELSLHIRVHTGEKTHVCDLCQKTFLTTSNLKQHLRTHTGDRPYCCTICDKTFSNKSNLMQHTKVHTGEKPFKCKFCEKSFTTTSNLTQHLRTHTGVKPYVCPVCNKAFINNSNLSQHKKIHGIERKKDICKNNGLLNTSTNSNSEKVTSS